jgi:hypothetical protein
MKLAPVVLFTFNRPKHTAETLNALAANQLVAETNLYIFSDGPRNTKDFAKIKEVRTLLHAMKAQSIFKNVIIFESKENKGLANSVISGVSQVFSEYNSVIVLEDDLVTSNDYLKFMNICLHKYEGNDKIGCFTGYNPLKKMPADYNQDVYFSTRTNSLGWATWKNIWNNVDWEAKAYNRFKKSFKQRKLFNATGYDRAKRLDLQMQKDAKSWSILFGFDNFINNKYTAYPKDSKLIHIGWDGTGTHHGGDIDKFNDKYKISKYPLKLPNEIVLEKGLIKLQRKLFGDGFIIKLKDVLIFIKNFLIH